MSSLNKWWCAQQPFLSRPAFSNIELFRPMTWCKKVSSGAAWELVKLSPSLNNMVGGALQPGNMVKSPALWPERKYWMADATIYFYLRKLTTYNKSVPQKKGFAVDLKYLTPSGPNLVQPARLQLKGSHEIWYKVYEKIWHNLQIKSNQLISCNECCTECTTLPQILLSIKALLLTKSPIARGTSLYNYWSGRKSFLGSICPWNC